MIWFVDMPVPDFEKDFALFRRFLSRRGRGVRRKWRNNSLAEAARPAPDNFGAFRL